tara:strand:- start:4455 stop:4658 length:204 start_codon:yes stop_codon:yes gene_type:complete
MKELYVFIASSPWLAFFIAIIFSVLIIRILDICISRPLRHMNIRKHGWPPEHCDADGDIIREEKEDE